MNAGYSDRIQRCTLFTCITIFYWSVEFQNRRKQRMGDLGLITIGAKHGANNVVAVGVGH